MVDDYRQKILDGLDRLEDWKRFEACAVELLADHGWSVVPIRGGTDAGMDGAIADGEGEAFQLVSTTAQNVIGNLTRNLDRYVSEGGMRRKVVVATSTALTPQKQQNLRDRAREKGFILLQTYEREAIASLLERNPRWTKKLLGVSGRPSALSTVPPSRRLVRDLPLIGRDADLEWVQETEGDRIVVGQPGSGKTYLLLQLVRQGQALFLVSEDEEAIADALRELRPKAVIVDDAHVDPERLVRLRRMREDEDIGADFDVIATTWPGGADEVMEALGLEGSGNRRDLELLTSAEILEILTALEVPGDKYDDHMKFLVSQSSNKPGLAVLLGSLWIRGDQKVFSGEDLYRHLVVWLNRILGEDPTLLLACYASGGGRGQKRGTVADFLDLSRQDCFAKTVAASHAGILFERGDHMVVQPNLLRAALIARVLPPSGHPLDEMLDLIEKAPDFDSALVAFIHAFLVGARIPPTRIRSLLRRTTSKEPWKLYAHRDEDAARWVLNEYTSGLEKVAEATFLRAPRATVHHLLLEAEKASTTGSPRLPPPLEAIQRWMSNLAEEDWISQGIGRRRTVVEVAKEYLRDGGDRGVALTAMFQALSPWLFGSSMSGVDLTFQWGRMLLPPGAISEFRKMWNEVKQEIVHLPPDLWQHLRGSLQYWVSPRMVPNDYSDAELREMRRFGQTLLADLVPRAEGNWALTAELERLAALGELEIEVRQEADYADYAVLFPTRRRSPPFADDRGSQRRNAEEMADRWRSKNPGTAVEILVGWERQARAYGQWAGATHDFASHLSKVVGNPGDWLAASLAEQCSLGGYFLTRTVAERRPDWRDLLFSALREPAMRLGAFGLILELDPPDPDLLEAALETAEPFDWPSSDIPASSLRRLLGHPDDLVVSSAVIAEWRREDSVRAEIKREWLDAVPRIPAREENEAVQDYYFLREEGRRLLGQNPDLAFRWLLERVNRNQPLEGVYSDGFYVAATGGLDSRGRSELIARLRPGSLAAVLLPFLIDEDEGLYRKLLDRVDMGDHHLDPLTGSKPGKEWKRLARMALDEGFAARDVAMTTVADRRLLDRFPAGPSREWQDELARLKNSDSELREIGVHGSRLFSGPGSRREFSKP